MAGVETSMKRRQRTLENGAAEATSTAHHPCGTLYLVGTPIGNLEDITVRALRILQEADVIACEDTRRTRGLLAHYQIRKPMVSYHEHNEADRARELVERMAAGESVALVSDAGMPLVSDPGFRLVRAAIERGLTVAPIPGPSALTAALAASGLPARRILFGGFLPAKKSARRMELARYGNGSESVVFFEAPHRIVAMLEDALEALGDREAVVAREMTKIHEEFLRGRISEILGRLRQTPPQGEMTVIFGPAADEALPAESPATLHEQIQELMSREAMSERDALKALARAQGVSKSALYRRLQVERQSAPRGGRGN